MHILPITYHTLDGEKITEEFCFNLTVPEVTELEFDKPGGMSKYYTRIVEARDAKALLAAYKEFILKAYGVKSEDGKRFIKSEELSIGFSQTDAYTVLFLSLLGQDASDSAFTDFIKAVVPSELMEKMPADPSVPEVNLSDGNVVKSEVVKTHEDYTRQQLLEMSDEDFDKIAGDDPLKMPHGLLQIAMQRKNRAQS